MMRIGIPRSLLYYQYFPLWKTFFEQLGAEVVVSPTTTQVMLAGGSARVIADTCLPVKVFLGHVIWLADKCDRIFIPAVRSIEHRVYNCSKFLGLPDMTKAVVPETPPLLEIDVDINKGKNRFYQAIYMLGQKINKNPLKIRRAGQAAWQSYLDYQNLMSENKLSPPDAIFQMYPEARNTSTDTRNTRDSIKGTVALIGHPYLIYDEYINHRLIHRLEQMGNRVITSEMVSINELKSAVKKVTGGAYWTYENEVAGAGGYYLENEADGIIGLMAFGCGPDSLMMDMVRRYSTKLKSTPFMCLTLEEHTAEAGVVTRLEAFTDMIYRRKRAESKVCV
jgi:predicted nucleotide-binding protein (sugar kinase/HSP70/actin superfamily)